MPIKAQAVNRKTVGRQYAKNIAEKKRLVPVGKVKGAFCPFGLHLDDGLTIHSLSLYGQIYPPMLVFIKLIVSRSGKTLTEKTSENVCRAIREALAGRFEVEEMLAVEFNLDAGLEQVETEFYVDPVFHLPALLIEADNQPGLCCCPLEDT